jgi:hypothetical protein
MGMTKYVLGAVCLAVGWLAGWASAESQTPMGGEGVGRGYEFIGLPDVQRRRYVGGLHDGLLLAPQFGAARRELNWYFSCAGPMSEQQAAFVLERYLLDHRDDWQRRVNGLYIEAMRAHCGAKAKPKPS